MAGAALKRLMAEYKRKFYFAFYVVCGRHHVLKFSSKPFRRKVDWMFRIFIYLILLFSLVTNDKMTRKMQNIINKHISSVWENNYFVTYILN